jgi:hypothetical protein
MRKSVAIMILALALLVIVPYVFFPSRIVNSVEIQGPDDRVFDEITTARYWPQWHPATLAVTGMIDHPMRLGDTIVEHVNIFGIPGNANWTVVMVNRPRSLRLSGKSGRFGRATIQYNFESRGNSVQFTRTLDYAFFGLSGPLDWFWLRRIMVRQSTTAVKNLKSLVEHHLQASRIPERSCDGRKGG